MKVYRTQKGYYYKEILFKKKLTENNKKIVRKRISKKEYDIYCDDGTPSKLLEIKKIKNRNIDFELGDYSSFMEKENGSC